MAHRSIPAPIANPDPSLALFVAAIGGGLLLGARPRRHVPARPYVTLAGLVLVGIAAHRPLAEALREVVTRRRAATLRFSFIVNRPVEEVFAFCADFENFPRFIGALRQVRDSGDGRSYWCASTPGGGEIEWDAVTTKFVTNSVIAWRNVAGTPVETTGLLRFSPEDGRTCVRVALDYRIFSSGWSDALASLVARSRAHEIEEDIRRLETHLPTVAATSGTVSAELAGPQVREAHLRAPLSAAGLTPLG